MNGAGDFRTGSHAFKTGSLFGACVFAAQVGMGGVMINEIQYHPSSEDVREEYVELHNTGDEAVNLEGWSLKRGVRFDFPKSVVPPHGYLVVASNIAVFNEKHPGVQPVVGDWDGILSNRGETIRLEDADGKTVDSVSYADEGNWAIRQKDLPHYQHQGWDWFAEHDGGGRSLELVNPSISNEHGQNWAASIAEGGTPGGMNSVSNADTAPLILDVRHFPMVPGSADRVRVTAQLVDEQKTGLSADLFYRPDTAENYQMVNMYDDGAHRDGLAADGLYGGSIPPHPDGTIVEFYLRVQDANDNLRIHPAVFASDEEPRANLLYQVDDVLADGSLPFYRIIMTPQERDYFLKMVKNSVGRFSNARMNATFISRTSGKQEIRYLVDVRNRGNGSRWKTPNNFRVDFPSDALWHGVEKINLNAQYPHIQLLGSVLCQQAGLLFTRSRLVRVRLNGQDLAIAGHSMYGTYAHNDVVDGDFSDLHNLGPVNVYRTLRTGTMEADFAFLGENPDPYRQVYFKQTNVSEDDWSDLIQLCQLLSETPEDQFTQAVEKWMDVDKWLRFFAIDTFFDNQETGLGNGIGDDYILFKNLSTNRHVLVPYDLDTILGRGDTAGNSESGLFRAAEPVLVSGHWTRPDQVARFLKHPAFVPLYFRELKQLVESIFSEEQFHPLLSQVLGGRVDEQEIQQLRDFTRARREFILSQIPDALSLLTVLPEKQGYRYSLEPSFALHGRANAIETRSVTVNGVAAKWSAWEARWTANAVSLRPGINRVSIQAFDVDKNEIDRMEIDVWFEGGSDWRTMQPDIAQDVSLTAAGAPWFVPAKIVVQKNAVLTVEAGASIYFGEGAGLEIQGQLTVKGEENKRVVLSRPPGTSHRWRGIRILNSHRENTLSHAVLSFAAGDAAVVSATNSKLRLQNVVFSGLMGTALEFSNTALELDSCSFETAEIAGEKQAPLVMGNGFLDGRNVVLRDNVFYRMTRVAPVLLFDGKRQIDAWLEMRGNKFQGGGTGAVFLTGCNALVMKNQFLDFRHPDFPAQKAGTVSVWGSDAPPISSVVLAGNIFDKADVAISLTGGASLEVHNNQFSGCVYAVAEFIAVPSPNQGGRRSAWTNNVFHENRELFSAIGAVPAEVVHVTHSLFSHTPFWQGDGNFQALPRPSMLGMGLYAADIGPTGNSIVIGHAHVPPSPSRTGQVRVWGPSLSHYRFRVNGGAYGDLKPVSEVLELTGLSEGQTTLEILGQDAAGIWMDQPHVLSWVVSDEASSILLSEVMAEGGNPAGSNAGDWIEIHNRGDFDVNLSGMSLTDDMDSPRKFVFPEGIMLKAGGYLTMTAGNSSDSELSLGFSLNQAGEFVALFDLPARGAPLLDSVEFGLQVSGYSISRLGGGKWNLSLPSPGKPNRPAPMNDALSLRVNEWLAKGVGSGNDDFVELFNTSDLPVALEGVSLSDEPLTRPRLRVFPALSFIAGGEALALHAEGAARRLGFQLSSDQGLIGLFSRDGSLIDQVWLSPQTPGIAMGRVPDGVGGFKNLSLPSPGALNPMAEPINPTPVSLTLVAMNDSWKYYQDQTAPPGNWHQPDFGDGLWDEGAALLAMESSELPSPKNTLLQLGSRTFYFRTHFEWSPEIAPGRLQLWSIIDDGVIFYLNGNEALRIGIPSGVDSHHEMLAGRNIIDATLEGPFTIDPGLLKPGDNVLAAEVHQVSGTSSDVVFGSRLEAEGMTVNGSAGLMINEVMVDNRSFPDAEGRHPDWVELYNPHPHPISLTGMGLSDSSDSPYRYVFPGDSVISAGGFFVVECNPEKPPSHANTGFGLKASGDEIYLYDSQTGGGAILDGLVFGFQSPDLTLGRNPLVHNLWVSCAPTSNMANKPLPTGDPMRLRVNEWMAAPDNGDDWFELFNPTGQPVDVGGFYLSDDPSNPTQHRLPDHSIIGGGYFRYQKINADASTNRGSDHVNFRLRAEGETIAIHDPNARLVDEVVFGPQARGVAEGRFPDGADSFDRFPSLPSPSFSNQLDSDRDELPDAWETRYGLAADNPEDALKDSDRDGINNLAEYLVGSDPMDDSSYLAVEEITLAADTFSVRFNAGQGIHYRVQVRDALVWDKWRTLVDIEPRAFAGSVTLKDPMPDHQQMRFYRIIVP